MKVVLVIEDDAATRRVLADTLMSAGYGVCEAFSGDLVPAVPRLDAVVSDIVTTPTAGIEEVREWTRRVAARFRAPVVVVTGKTEVARQEPAALGVADVIAKPFDTHDLVSRVKRAMSCEERAA